MQKFIFTSILLISITVQSLGQKSALTSDELLEKARSQAFELKDYPKAIQSIKEGLLQSPDYTDLSIFLGRLYTWSSQPDSARVIFQDLLDKNIESEDFYLAYGSLEYWEEQYSKATSIVDKGLTYTPNSEGLWLLKSKIHYGENAYEQADKAVSSLLSMYPKNTEARELANKIRDYTQANALSVVYNYVHFDKQFEHDWHITGISYKRRTGLGTVIFRTNVARKFDANGVQFEIDAYPRLSKMFYMYVGAGYSNQIGIFPKYRTGVSLYANLPYSFEGEVGYRQLYFSDNLIMYTGSIGKYFQNFWFNARTFITPSNKAISHSYTGTIRYYTKGANDFIGLQVGTGISPEENRNNFLELAGYKMKSFRVGLDYYFTVGKRNLFQLSGLYFNQEYLPFQKGNQLDFTVGYTRTF